MNGLDFVVEVVSQPTTDLALLIDLRIDSGLDLWPLGVPGQW